MRISLDSIQKKFIQYPIFKGVTLNFKSPETYAILGANGSGKSTLLRIIAGMQSPSKGKIHYTDNNGKEIPKEQLYHQVSYCAPGMEIIEEMTLREFLDFHFHFKPILPDFTVEKIIETIKLPNVGNKLIGDFSSGMKQRVKLAQAIFTNSPILLLDEPCSNLDQQGVQQYLDWTQQYSQNRLLIIASNEEREYSFCQHLIKIEDYK